MRFSIKLRVQSALTAACCVLGAGFLASEPSLASSLVTNGNFSAGNTGFSRDYSYVLPPTKINNETQYTVTAAGNIGSASIYSDWTSITTDPSGGNGNVLLANGATTSGDRVWYQSATGLSPNTNYTFSFYGADVNSTNGSNATLEALVNGTNIGTLDTVNGWLLASLVWNSGSSTTVTLSLIDTNTQAAFNDFAVDQISFSAASPTPIPAALPLFATGLGALGLLGWRRKRKAAALAF